MGEPMLMAFAVHSCIRCIWQDRHQLLCTDYGILHVHVQNNTKEIFQVIGRGLFLSNSYLFVFCIVWISAIHGKNLVACRMAIHVCWHEFHKLLPFILSGNTFPELVHVTIFHCVIHALTDECIHENKEQYL